MHHLLILEDEELLRASVRRGLSQISAIEIVDVGTFAQALEAIDERPPDLVLSDLNLPDRSGIELLGELAARDLAIPIVFMSAYLESFRGELQRHPYVDVLEKPVAMEALRELIERRLEMLDRSAAALPFGVADYLQLAGMGRHSVVIEPLDHGRSLGQIVVFRGVLWSAQDRRGRGDEAFSRLATAETGRVVCRTLHGQPKATRMFERSWESMLLDAVRLHDEAQRDFGDQRLQTMQDWPAVGASDEDLSLDDGWLADDEPPTAAPSPAKSFDVLLEEGLDALLERDYPEAVKAFLAARDLRPEDGRVLANLERLRALGHLDAAPKAENL